MDFDLIGKAVKILQLPTVDYYNSSIKVIPAQKGDVNSRYFCVKLFDDRGDISLKNYTTVVLNATLPDGTPQNVKGEIDKENNTAICKLASSMISQPGRVSCDILLSGTDSDGIAMSLTSQTFYVLVAESQTNNEAIEGNDDYTLLVQLINEVSELEKNIEAAEEERVNAEAERIASMNSIFSNTVNGTLYGKAARADDVSPLYHNFNNISIKGESTQASKPTLELPVEVVNCENPTLKIFRKNLLKNPDSVTSGMSGGVTVTAKTDGSLTLDGMVDESKLNNSFCLYKNDTTPLITLRAGVAYKIRLLDEDGNVFSNQFSTRVVDGKGYGSLFTNNGSSYTPTIDKPIYRIFLYALTAAVGTTYENKVVYPILEVVGEGDEYDEYNEQSVTIPLTLAGQGDYKDEIVVDRNTNTVKHIQRYYKYEFTGEEDWDIVSSSYSVNTTLAGYNARDAVKVASAAKQFCDVVPCNSSAWANDIMSVYATSPSTLSYAQIFARIPTVDATSADFKEVFKSGTYLWYPMANPIETDYTDTEWGQALLALVSDGETLTFDCDAETVISYNKDINKVIQKLTDAIIALGGTI